MKKIFFVFFLIVSLIVSAIPASAKSLFNKKNGEAIVLGIIVNRIANSEQDRKNKRKDDKKNERDIERNRAKIQMQMERDEYNRQKKLQDLRFQQEINSYNNQTVIVYKDPQGKYKIAGVEKIFSSAKSIGKYLKKMFPDEVKIIVQEVDSLDE